MSERTGLPWWAETTIYQVYPRSFQDSDGDGIGDLAGITSRLDHLVDLGVGTLWVSPFFSSPQRDFGYDITDYRGVAPEYGTLDDVDTLIGAAHERGIKVMFDLVLNHTSDEHPWFVESRASREGPKADWYIWADGRGPGWRLPPNNWRNTFQVRTAWHFAPERGQWYLASFLGHQPDLNWRNPEVEAELFDTVRFWLRRGVDGFRLDMFGAIMKDPALRSNPMGPSFRSLGSIRLLDTVHTENTDDSMALARRLRAVCEEFDGDRVLLGEVFGETSRIAGFADGPDGPGLHLVFLFDFLEYRYSADWLARTVNRFEQHFPFPLQPTYVLENHDRSRLVDRVGGDLAKARVMATVLLTLRGVPTIYQGQELGTPNTYLPLAGALDPVAAELGWVPEAISKRLPERINRDEVRTPMRWGPEAGAGFCPDDVTPWLPVGTEAPSRNVAEEADDPGSVLALYRRLLALRRATPALHSGRLDFLAGVPGGCFAFTRTALGPDEGGTDDDRAPARVVVAANLGDERTELAVPGATEVLAATDPRVNLVGERLHLPSDTAAVVAAG